MGACASVAPCQSEITEHKNALPRLEPLDSLIHHGGGVYQAFACKGALSLSRLDGCVGRVEKPILAPVVPRLTGSPGGCVDGIAIAPKTDCGVHKHEDEQCTGDAGDLTESRPLDRYIAHSIRLLIPRAEKMRLLSGGPKPPVSHDLHGHDRLLGRFNHCSGKVGVVP